ncbi:MAG TPA: hypothetical protein VF159_06505 [Gemmatimonadaceae bacterium]
MNRTIACVAAVALVVTACGGTLAPWVTEPIGTTVVRGDSVAFTATTRMSGDSVVVAATAINISTRPVRLEWGACEVDVLLFRTADGSGTPAFDWAKRPPPAGMVYGCPLYLAMKTLIPGESMSPNEFRVAMPVSRLGVDTLGAGTYYVTAKLIDMHVAVPAGRIELR